MLAELAPVFSGAVNQPNVDRAVIMAQVVYKDGRTDTLELSQQGATKPKAAKAKAKAKPKAKKAKGTPLKKEKKAPIRVEVKEFPPEQGTPKEEEPKKKRWGCPKVRKWVPEPEWVGETEYKLNGYYVPMAILKADERYLYMGYVLTREGGSMIPIRNEKGHRVVPPWSQRLRVLRTNDNLFGWYLYTKQAA
jgi:hypothetical protein